MVNREQEIIHLLRASLCFKIRWEITDDEYNPDDWFSDDKGGEWHVLCPTNPYGENYDPEGERYNPIAWVEDYAEQIIPEDLEKGIDADYILLHEYLYLMWPYESEHIRTLTLVQFSKIMDIDFSDVLDLVAMHPTKPSTTGLSKLRKELQGVNKKVLTDMVHDYIAMMKEAGMPSINEEHLIATKDRYSTIAEFWHIYGAMAVVVNGFDIDHAPNQEAHKQALARFKEKITDDKTVLYPLLANLYQHWADDEDWRKQQDADERMWSPSHFEDILASTGYAGLMYAKQQLEPWRIHDPMTEFASMNPNRKQDWHEFVESNGLFGETKGEALNSFIKNKYFT